jgi:hypothetical protein
MAMTEMHEYYHDTAFTSRPIEVQFKTLLEAYCAQAKHLGVDIVAHQPETFKRFLSFDPQRQNLTYKIFQSYYAICSRAIQQDIDLNDNHSLIWWALKEIGLRPPSDLFQQLQKDDVIEIYDPNFIQVFRTFNFFKLCGYSLDQILCYEWYELYKRDENITKHMVDVCSDIIAGKIRETLHTKFPDHIVEQPLAKDKKAIKIQHRFVSPLHGSNGIHMLNVFKVSKVDTPIKPELREFPIPN